MRSELFAIVQQYKVILRFSVTKTASSKTVDNEQDAFQLQSENHCRGQFTADMADEDMVRKWAETLINFNTNIPSKVASGCSALTL